MARLLHIDASGRSNRSHTRRLTSELAERIKSQHTSIETIYRDLSIAPPPHVNQEWIAAAFTNPDERTQEMNEALKISDVLVDELLSADILVFGVPMYNFSVPSSFKAYIDQIVRVGRTFAFTPEDPESTYKQLVHGKKLYIVSARGDGGFGPGGHNEHNNHLDPYLKSVFGFLGITDITFITVENDEFGGLRLGDSIKAAQQQILKIAA